MLLKRCGQCLSFLFAIIALFFVLPMQATAEDATVWNNPRISSIQIEIDRILSEYSITEEMTEEEIRAAIDGENFDYLYALYETNELDAVIGLAYDSGELSDAEFDALISKNTQFCVFAQALQDKYTASGGVALLTESTAIPGLKIIDTGNVLSVTGTSASVVVESNRTAYKDNTITIENISGSHAILSFHYVAADYNSFTIQGVTVDSTGDYSVELDDGETATFYIQAKKGRNAPDATLTISNIALLDPDASFGVTFLYDTNLGSVKVSGVSISPDNPQNVSVSGLEVVATPNSGNTFVGWINSTTKMLLSTSATYTLKPSSDMTVVAAFTSSTSKAWFSVGSYYFDDLNAAATFAASASTKVVVPVANGTLPASSYTIPDGVTLLLPYDTAYTCNTEPNILGSHTTPSAFRTLTMASGASITVKDGGVINVASEVSAVGQNADSWNGTPSGPHGRIQMNDGSSITLESGATLYAYGYVAGTGTVLASSGSTVYECFQIRDWRGGSATCGSTTNALRGKLNSVFTDNGIFPVNQYYIQNIEARLTIEGGATEKIFAAANASIATPSTTGVFIGSGGLFAPASGQTVTKYYSAADDRLIVELDGDASLSSMAIQFYIVLGTMDLNSENFVLPLPNNVTIKINSGTATVAQDIALVPGGEIIIAEGATLKLSEGKSAYIYDKDEWGSYAADSLQLVPVGYSDANGTAAMRNNDSLVDAKIDVNGTVIIDGAAYTTAGGANITSSEGSGIVTINAIGTEANTYQATQSNTTMTKVDIPITPAKLRNENTNNGTLSVYTDTTATGTYYYHATHKRWVKDGHNFGEVTYSGDGKTAYSASRVCACGCTETATAAITSSTIDPTCTDVGSTTYTATFGIDWAVGTTVTEEIPALGHTAGDAVEENRVEATFDKAGSYDSVVYCSVCGEEVSRTPVEIPKLVAVARIGSTKYETLAAAYTALLEGDTIVILDASTADEDVTFDKCCTVDASALGNFSVNTATGYTAENKTGGIWYVNTSLFDIYASNLKAGDSLDLYFYVQTSDLTIADLADYSAEIVRYRNGTASEKVSIPGSQWTAYGSDYYRFCYGDIAAKEMTDKLFITIYKSTTKVSDTRMESVENYALRVLKSVASAEDGSENAALRTTLVDMLYYGAECQGFFSDYNIEYRADANLGEFAQYESVDQTPTNNVSDVDGYLKASTITAETSLVYTLYFDSEKISRNMAAYVSYVNHSGTTVTLPVVTGDGFNTSKSDLIGVDVTGLAVADGKQIITCTIKESTAADAETVTEVQGSIESYIAVDNGNTLALQKLMNFIVSAHDYFHFGES